MREALATAAALAFVAGLIVWVFGFVVRTASCPDGSWSLYVGYPSHASYMLCPKEAP